MLKANNRLLREHTHLKILSTLALRGGALSWSDAMKASRLSRDAFAKGVLDLKKDGLLRETLKRSGEIGRPRVILSLSRESRSRIRGILGPMRQFQGWEELSLRFSSAFETLTNRKKKKGIRNMVDEYLIGVIYAIIGIFIEVALMKEESDPLLKSFVSTEAFETIHNLVWREEFVTFLSSWTHEAMEEDRAWNMKQFEKVVSKLEREARKQQRNLID